VVKFESNGGIPVRPEGCLVSNAAAALSNRDEDVKNVVVSVHATTRAQFTAQIRRAIDAGEIDAGLDVEDTALALMTVMQGIDYMRKCGIDGVEFEQARDAAVAMVVRATSV